MWFRSLDFLELIILKNLIQANLWNVDLPYGASFNKLELIIVGDMLLLVNWGSNPFPGATFPRAI